MTPERLHRIKSVLSKRQTDITVVLENVFDPHNVSAVMRSCDAVGVQEIFVLNTRVPLHHHWGYKSSRSAAKWITAHQFDNAQECFKEVRKKYHKIVATALTSDAVGLYDMDLTQNIAFVFGNEREGVSDEICAIADAKVVIPQVGMIRSLNISVACGVTLFEAFRQKQLAGHYNSPHLSIKQFETLSKAWGVLNDNI